jgi:L-methionine (R)-S-oxide reductase
MQKLQNTVTQLVDNEALSVGERLEQICELLRSSIRYYDWVGFYFHEDATQTLKLRAFAGEPTDHTIIPFGKGICGQVALSNENFIVPDVSAQDNYIACSLTVKSEIVIPLFKNGKNIGQIDIDSHTPDPFTENDVKLLEFINHKVAEIV